MSAIRAFLYSGSHLPSVDGVETVLLVLCLSHRAEIPIERSRTKRSRCREEGAEARSFEPL